MERSEAADVLAEASRLAGTRRENDNASANGSRDARRVFVDVRTVTSLFEAYQPHLVFLHSCDGDVPSLTSVYSTARAIVYSSVPAVVAMQYQISAGDAIRFVKEFYHQLAAGCSVGEAVAAGRRNLAKGGEDTGIRQDWSTRLFGTPVVYLRRDSPLVSEPVEAPRSNPQAPGPPPTGQLTCPGCGSPLSATAPACPECGLQLQCASCGARYERPGITKFCSMCRPPVPKTPGPVRSEVITVSGRWKRT